MLTLVKKLMLEYQNIKTFFAKGLVPNWSEEVFVITKVKKYCGAVICYW